MNDQKYHTVAICLVIAVIAVVMAESCSHAPRVIQDRVITSNCEHLAVREIKFRSTLKTCLELMETPYFNRDGEWYQSREEFLQDYEMMTAK